MSVSKGKAFLGLVLAGPQRFSYFAHFGPFPATYLARPFAGRKKLFSF